MDTPTAPEPGSIRTRLTEDCAELERLLSGLPGADEKVPEQIHAIRKLGKSLRGGFSLIGLQNTAGREIQAVGRLLSTTRDATSRRNTWKRLEWNEQPETANAITRLLDQETECHRPPAESIAWCAARAAEARAILDALDEETLSRRARSGVAKLRRKVKKRSRNLGSRDDCEFHETRKALKAYLGALKYLPKESAPPAGVEQLANLLGDENDLATFSAWLDGHGFSARLVPDLWKHLLKRTRKVHRKAIRSAKKLDS